MAFRVTYSRKGTIMIKNNLTEDEYNELFKDGTLTHKDIRGVEMVKILKPIVKSQKQRVKRARRL